MSDTPIDIVTERWIASRHRLEWFSAFEWTGGDKLATWDILKGWGWKWSDTDNDFNGDDVLEMVWIALFDSDIGVYTDSGQWVPTDTDDDDYDLEVLGVNFRLVSPFFEMSSDDDIDVLEEEKKNEEY